MVDTTLHKPTPRALRSAQHSSKSPETAKLCHKATAEQRKLQLVECSRVVELTEPADGGERDGARRLADYIHRKLEAGLAADGGSDEESHDSCNEEGGSPDWPNVAVRDREMLNVDKFRHWLEGRLSGEPEKLIYQPFADFVEYVACWVEASMSASSTDAAADRIQPRRALLACNLDLQPTGSDESTQVGAVLIAQPDTTTASRLNRANYRDALALEEVKPTRDQLYKAYEQLLHYSQQVYATQHNRSFVWGFTLCDRVLRVVLFTNDHAVASDDMDLGTSKGRRAFIWVLVDLSYCDEQRLGYNKTVVWLAGTGPQNRGYWTIECVEQRDAADGEAQLTVTYYARDPDIVAVRLFGRHMRGFLASRDLDKVDEPDTFIKYAWSDTSESARDDPDSDPRDKVAMVREVSRMLAEDPRDNDPPFIVFKHGGPVRHTSGTGSHVVESTAAVLGPILEHIEEQGRRVIQPRCPRRGRHRAKTEDTVLEPFPFRIHKRIAMSPIGQPLATLESPYELIIVLTDAMRAHARLLECGILHRDISANNILVVRGPDNNVRGVLTDLDCAIRVGVERDQRPERTGTPPFMSISNLENSSVPRSELDDWESALYIACWLGVYGVSEVDRINCQEEIEEDDNWVYCALDRWDAGSFEDIAEAKRIHVGLRSEFHKNILMWFMVGDGYKALERLVIEMRACLFFNASLKAVCHGVFLIEIDEPAPSLSSFDGGESDDFSAAQVTHNRARAAQVDPFKCRYDEKETISKQLLEVMEAHADKAKAALKP